MEQDRWQMLLEVCKKARQTLAEEPEAARAGIDDLEADVIEDGGRVMREFIHKTGARSGIWISQGWRRRRSRRCCSGSAPGGSVAARGDIAGGRNSIMEGASLQRTRSAPLAHCSHTLHKLE